MGATSTRIAIVLLAALAAASVLAAPPEDDGERLPAAAARAVDFAADVEPILATRCVACHGPTKQKGDLRLDSRDALLSGGKSGPAIVERDGRASAILRRAAGLDGKKAMPLSGRRLSDAQLALVRAWIDQGAPWPADHEIDRGSIEEPRHWAYQPITSPALPDVQHVERVRDPIDRFVEARLEQEGVEPAPEADRATLLRRLSLDLVGLPPTPEEVDAFVADANDGAFERQVDRLLASPHFGEKWARWWLDLARYADTHGHEKDPQRTMWRWRDWVIDAFDRDLPFDRFTTEQIAGDLLPDADESTRLATGFHRNTMKNDEGGVDPEEDRNHVLVDRVNTTATAWLGSTLQCAQCHDHKFDAFTQEDYYRFYAFFADAAEVEVPAPTAEFRANEARRNAEIAAMNATLAGDNAEWDAAFDRWAATPAIEPRWRALVPKSVASLGGATATIAQNGDVLLSGANPDNDRLTLVVDVGPATAITALRFDVLTDPSLFRGGPGRGENGSFVINKVSATVAPADHPETARPLVFTSARADYVQSGHRAENLVDDVPGPGWATDAWKDDGHVPRAVVLLLAEPLVLDAPATLVVKIVESSQWPRATVGKFRVSATEDAHAELAFAGDAPLRAALALEPARRSEPDVAICRTLFRSIAPETLSLRQRIAAASASFPMPPTALVMAPATEHRPSHLLRKGNFLDPGPEVSAGVPAVLPQIATQGATPADRLALARWLVSKDNPLTARVIVNRVFAELFGRGLVATQDDFGVQGEPPTHPELLDHLASSFVADGWSTKRLIRRLVTSAAWRRSSRVTPDALERDPSNRWLARANRWRVEAETVRDVALSAAGLLSEKKFGPSVFPPQPDGVWSMIYSADKWETSTGEDRHRRGLYTFWRRTAPYPSFVAFDAPSREVTCTRRVPTTTPLQALVTLNDPAFFECAQALAGRMEDEGGASAAERVRRGFRLCAGRAPSDAELARLSSYLDAESAALASDAESATKLAGDGATAERAALVMVGNVLLNLDETLTRE